MGSHAGKLSSRVVQTELLRCFTSHFIKEACRGTHIMMCETDISRCSDGEAKGGRKKQERVWSRSRRRRGGSGGRLPEPWRLLPIPHSSRRKGKQRSRAKLRDKREQTTFQISTRLYPLGL